MSEHGPRREGSSRTRHGNGRRDRSCEAAARKLGQRCTITTVRSRPLGALLWASDLCEPAFVFLGKPPRDVL